MVFLQAVEHWTSSVPSAGSSRVQGVCPVLPVHCRLLLLEYVRRNNNIELEVKVIIVN